MKEKSCMNRIKALRAATGLSQAAFAKMYDIPNRSFESWEQGRREAPPYLVSLLERVVMYDSIILNRFKDTQKDVKVDVEVPEELKDISEEALSKIAGIEVLRQLLEQK